MTKIDIYSGFLGAGKTTLIKKMIDEGYQGEKLVLIENEFGEIGIDGGFLKDAGVEINEMNSGCICCSLVGDFGDALKKVVADFSPDRILIEPSGVGKLSDVIKAVKAVDGVDLNGFSTVVDVNKCKMYMKNFGEFFNDQIETSGCIILSHTASASGEKIASCVEALREHNEKAVIVTTDWDNLSGEQLLKAMEQKNTLDNQLESMSEEKLTAVGHHEHHHHHDEECSCHEHHHDHDEDCSCHEHHHHHDEECGCHEHHHHHDEECGCHEHHHHDEDCSCHEHHHHHDEECSCHEHHHHDGECDCHEHHHHHADDVFTSWGAETVKKYTKAEVESILKELEDSNKYGTVLRAKGMVAGDDSWIYFDYIPEEPDVRNGSPEITGRICVIGSEINEDNLRTLFGITKG